MKERREIREKGGRREERREKNASQRILKNVILIIMDMNVQWEQLPLVFNVIVSFM
jgi:hypothetical protein